MNHRHQALVVAWAALASLPAVPGCTAPSATAGRPSLAGRLREIEAGRLAALRQNDTRSDRRQPPAGQQFTLAAGWPAESGAQRTESPQEHGAADAGPDAPRQAGQSPLPGFRDTLKRDLRDLPKSLWTDTKRVYADTGNLLILGMTYGASLTIQETGPDDTVENSFRTHHTFEPEWRDAFGALGNPGTHFGVAGLLYLAGQVRQDDRTYEVGSTLFRALTITGLSAMLAQTASWDDGPNGEWGAFPSAHTASTFAMASVMHREYGPWVGFPLYALGGLVAYERLEDREHYFSDVVMGGVLGLVIGHTVAGDGKPLILFGGEIQPYADPVQGSSGLAWVKNIN